MFEQSTASFQWLASGGKDALRLAAARDHPARSSI